MRMLRFGEEREVDGVEEGGGEEGYLFLLLVSTWLIVELELNDSGGRWG